MRLTYLGDLFRLGQEGRCSLTPGGRQSKELENNTVSGHVGRGWGRMPKSG